MENNLVVNEENELIRKLMRSAIDAGKKCKAEDEEYKPKVGASIELNGEILGYAFRGELGDGNHAEFTLLEKKLKNIDLTGSTLYTTLEPCTERKTKTPCVDWIIKRGIKKVYIGMLDPNKVIFGNGYSKLKNSGIEVLSFPPDLQKEIEEDNLQFISYCKLFSQRTIQSLDDLPYHISPQYRSLDDWYFIINRIYFDKNFTKDTNQIFAHLVEVLGSLSIISTNKVNKIGELNMKEQIAKALSWWFALCGKMGIRSVETMLFLKFPAVCPYCRESPHNNDKCVEIKLGNTPPNWSKLYEISKTNHQSKPNRLAFWQQMFYKIYPVSQSDSYDKVLARFTEEMGELAEAVRVFKISPSYFLSEASDVFAWLMHLSNSFESSMLPLVKFENRGTYLEEHLFKLYPDKCLDCNQIICSCPPILQTTIGRITNDGPDLQYFEEKLNFYMSKAEIASQFDFGSKKIIINLYEFEVSSKFIKTLYNFSKSLELKIRHLKNITNEMADKIISALQIIISFSTTQRATQKSVDRLLRLLLELSKDQLLELKPMIQDMPESELKRVISDTIFLI